ncbi:MAG: DUF4129 domain-containing protein [Chitinophagaceae bacterium]|nr:DUF4129 domain-containing protein [Chitinophagaceae bacterium]
MKIFVIIYCLLICSSPFGAKAGQVPDSVVHKMQKQKEFRYANDPSYWDLDKPEDDGDWTYNLFLFLSTNPIVKWIAYIILGIIIVVVIYQVAASNNFFSFSKAKRKNGDGEIPDDQLTAEDIDLRINEAINNKEYRTAIRYLYLKTLNALNEKNKIQMHAKATNYDYLQQMKSTTGYNDFALLTRIYEYVWYGEFQPGEQQFEKINNNFNQFISRS